MSSAALLLNNNVNSESEGKERAQRLCLKRRIHSLLSAPAMKIEEFTIVLAWADAQ